MRTLGSILLVATTTVLLCIGRVAGAVDYQAIWKELKPFGQENPVFDQASAGDTDFATKAVAYNELLVGGSAVKDQGDDAITALHVALVHLFSSSDKIKGSLTAEKVTPLTQALAQQELVPADVHKAAFDGLFLHSDEIANILVILNGLVLVDFDDVKELRSSPFVAEFAASDTLTLQALRKQVKGVELLSKEDIEGEIITNKKAEFITMIKSLKAKCTEEGDKKAYASNVLSLLANHTDKAPVQELMFTEAFDEKVGADELLVGPLVEWKLSIIKAWIEGVGSAKDSLASLQEIEAESKELTRLAFREQLIQQTKFFNKEFDKAAVLAAFNFKPATFEHFAEIVKAINAIELFDSAEAKTTQERLVSLLAYLSETAIDGIDADQYATVLLSAGEDNVFNKLKVASESIVLMNVEELKSFVPSAFAGIIQKWNPFALVEELEFVKEPKIEFTASAEFVTAEEALVALKTVDLKAFKVFLKGKGITTKEKLQSTLDLICEKSSKWTRTETLATINGKECKEEDKVAVLKKIYEHSMVKLAEEYDALASAEAKELLFSSRLQFALWLGGLFKTDENVLGKALTFGDFSLEEANAIDIQTISASAIKFFASKETAIKGFEKFIAGKSFLPYFQSFCVEAKAAAIADNLTLAKLVTQIPIFETAIANLHYSNLQDFIAGNKPAFYTLFVEGDYFDVQAEDFDANAAIEEHEFELSSVFNQLTSTFSFFKDSADKEKYWPLFDACAEMDSVFMTSQAQAAFAAELAKAEEKGDAAEWWASVLGFVKTFLPLLQEATKDAQDEEKFIAALTAQGEKAKNGEIEALAIALATVPIYGLEVDEQNSEAYSVALNSKATVVKELIVFLNSKDVSPELFVSTLSGMTAEHSCFRLRNKDYNPDTEFNDAQEVATFVVGKFADILARLKIVLLLHAKNQKEAIVGALESLWKPSGEAVKYLESNFFFFLNPVTANRLDKSILVNYFDLNLLEMKQVIAKTAKINKKFIQRTSDKEFIEKDLKVGAQLTDWLSILDTDSYTELFAKFLASHSGFLKAFMEAYADYKLNVSKQSEKSDTVIESKTAITMPAAKKPKAKMNPFVFALICTGIVLFGVGCILIGGYYVWEAVSKNAAGSSTTMSSKGRTTVV